MYADKENEYTPKSLFGNIDYKAFNEHMNKHINLEIETYLNNVIDNITVRNNELNGILNKKETTIGCDKNK
ncbi:MAG: hypothetical protein R3Y35_00375 [Clostridia bacterium]